MKTSHPLHGRIKKFWMFMAVTSLVAFAANTLTQLLFKDAVDFSGAAAISLTMGIVLAVFLTSQNSRRKH
jgi:uncharacterized protein YqgC (DUF456 family)